jgi:hypothetical protein
VFVRGNATHFQESGVPVENWGEALGKQPLKEDEINKQSWAR